MKNFAVLSVKMFNDGTSEYEYKHFIIKSVSILMLNQFTNKFSESLPTGAMLNLSTVFLTISSMTL